jgi:hypothetical protein
LQQFEALNAFLSELLHILILLRPVLFLDDLVDNGLLIAFHYKFIVSCIILLALYMDLTPFPFQILIDKALELKPLSGLSRVLDFLLGKHIQAFKVMIFQDDFRDFLEKLYLLE